MSLLLEALKKAELAKQGAKSAQEPAPPPAAAELTVESPVMTRENLPDISQPLEIFTEDLPSARREPTIETREPAPPPPAPEPAAPFIPQQQEAAPVSAEQGRARQLFEAKEMDYNPKRPFYLTLGALGLAAAGYGGYVWWQLQPRYSVNTTAIQNAAKSAPAPEQAAVSASAPAQAPSPTPGASQAPAAETPAAPAATAAQPAAAQPAAGPAARAPAPAPQPAPTPAPKGPVFTRGADAPAAIATAPPAARAPASATRRKPAATSAPVVTVTPATLQVDPVLASAYEAFQRGDLALARDSYQRALQREPRNRDALLGLAAIDIRNRDYDTAEARYIKLLEIDPRDTLAQAGMLSLRGQLDPVQSESRIKTLLAAHPEATHLYFTLGNQYAQQNRWSEAQAAYFKAFAADPDNPDYAFNLAVSLDQLRQVAPALEYYQRSLAAAQRRPGGFDPGRAQARIDELRRAQ